MELTAQQIRFVQEYLICFDGTDAAIAAGYSEKSAPSTATALLNMPKIREAIGKSQANFENKCQITREKVLEDIKRIGDKAESYGRYGDALKAAELLGKSVGAFTDVIENRHTFGAPVEIIFRRKGNDDSD